MKKLMKLSLIVLVLGLALGIGGKAAGGRLYSVIHGQIQPVDWNAIQNELRSEILDFDRHISPDDRYVSPNGHHNGWFDDDDRAPDWDDRYDPDDWFVPYDPDEYEG